MRNNKQINVSVEAQDRASKAIAQIKERLNNISKNAVKVPAPNLSRVESAINRAARDRRSKINVEANTESAMRSIEGLKSKLSNMGANGGMSGLAMGFIGGAAAAGITAATEAISNAIDGLKSKFVDYNSSLEQTKVAFTSMLGSAQEASKVMQQLKQFAAATPFEFKDIVPAAQQLKAFGFDAQELIPTLTAIGNAASGLGKGTEGLKQMAFVFGQIRSTGKLMGQDVMQLSALGVPVKEILAKNLGLTADQLANVGAAGIDAKTAIDALAKGMNERFPDMMKNFSNTFEGMLSTIRDNFDQIMGKMGEGLFNTIKGAVSKIKDIMTTMLNNVNENGLAHIFDNLLPKNTGEQVAAAFDSIGQALDALKPGFDDAIDRINTIFSLLLDTAGFDVFNSALDALLTAVVNTFNIANGIMTDFVNVWAWVVNGVRDSINRVVDIFNQFYYGASSAFVAFANKYLSIAGNWLKSLYDGVSNWISRILDKLGWVGQGIRAIGKAVGVAINAAESFFVKSKTVQAIANFKMIHGSAAVSQSHVSGGGYAGNVEHASANSGVGGGSGGAVGKAAKAVNDIAQKVAEATKKVADMFKSLQDKMMDETGTVYEKAMAKLKSTLDSMRQEMKKAQDLGVDTSKLKEQMVKYEDLIKNKILKKLKEANIDLANATRLAQAKLIGDKRAEAEAIFEIDRMKLERQREQKLKEVAMTMDSAQAKLNVEAWYNAQLGLLTKQRDEAALKAPQTYAEAWTATLSEAYDKLKDKGAQFKQLSDGLFSSMTDNIQTVFTDVLTGNFDDIGKAFQNMLRSMLSSIAKFLANQLVTKLITGLFGGGGSGGFGYAPATPGIGLSASSGALASYMNPFASFGGFRATGGPVSAMRSYIVGEHGPELFRPTSNGRIDNTFSVGNTQAPKVNVVVNNNSGQQMDAQANTKFDGEAWVTSVVINAVTTNRDGIRDVLKGV